MLRYPLLPPRPAHRPPCWRPRALGAAALGLLLCATSPASSQGGRLDPAKQPTAPPTAGAAREPFPGDGPDLQEDPDTARSDSEPQADPADVLVIENQAPKASSEAPRQEAAPPERPSAPSRAAAPAPPGAASPPPARRRPRVTDGPPRVRRQWSPQHFAFELRLGPYFPRSDENVEGTPTKDFFGDKKRLYIGAEFDWQIVRIPLLGTAGVGFGLGYTRLSGSNLVPGGAVPDGDVDQSSTLTIIPMYAVGVLRVDEAALRYGIPIVPYGKLGFGYALWNVNDGVGLARNEAGISGRDRSTGVQSALGAMFLLDVLDLAAARSLDVGSGVNHSYVFLEWSRSSLGSGGEMNVGANTWVAGLALEF